MPPMPPPAPAIYNTTELRGLLMAAFSDEELTAFCYDFFRRVYDQFSVGMSRPEKAQRLLADCESQGRTESLLARVQAANPHQYARFADRLCNPDCPLPSGKSDAQAEQEYLAYLRETHSQVSFLFIKPQGSRQPQHDAALETVFVPLEVQDPEAEERMRQRAARGRPEELAREGERPQPVTINEALARYPVFLLKGLPGSGKTTLLRHVTTCFATGEAAERLGWQGAPLLPILAPLRNFGRFLQVHAAEFINPAPAALDRFIESYFADNELDLPPRFFQSRLEAGRCLVLLDGLDEVADRGLRATVAQMVSAFIKRYAPRGNRFGLASRPRGYDEVAAHLPRPVVCTVQPLTPEGRDELVTNLLRVLEPHARQRNQQTADLIADIHAKEKVDELSRNPLFCTTLVLVYKYQRTALPERRVDVYDELVKLLLGFWETHKAEREGVAEVRELVMQDGTGRSFMDERDAVEAKRRALVEIADWMQEQKLAEAPKTQVEGRLARFFREREGARPEEEQAWARNFLAVAHARSGLFIEAQPDVYAFSHQNFREYLAATRLIGRRDAAMAQAVADHAADAWWEEVFLLALAYPGQYDEQREYLLECLRTAGHLTLAGRGAIDAGARLPAPLREQIKAELHARMIDARFTPKERYTAGEIWDELGGLPEDLDAWIYCARTDVPGAFEAPGTQQALLAAKYPVTNTQFDRFIQADGYSNPDYWGGEDSPGWRWRLTEHNAEWRGAGPVTQPEYWQRPRFGKDRRGYPVVGVSWYEAAAYAAWLTERLRIGDFRFSIVDPTGRTQQSKIQNPKSVVRLPTEAEWLWLAGGEKEDQRERYPWDMPGSGRVTDDQKDKDIILAQANTAESGLSGTSPVAMYPLGESRPFRLWDVAGNVWEWTDSWYNKEQTGRVVRGGSWYYLLRNARPSVRLRLGPDSSFDNIGFRLVSPISSGS